MRFEFIWRTIDIINNHKANMPEVKDKNKSFRFYFD